MQKQRHQLQKNANADFAEEPKAKPAKAEPAKRASFEKPTVEEIAAYCSERKNGIDPQAFFDFYESKGWKVGAVKMKDWRASVRTWEQRHKNEGGRRRVVVGFAAETNDLVANAQAKLARKGCDLVVANDVTRSDSGFGTETNRVTLVSASGVRELPTLPKREVAARLLDEVERLLS